MPDPTASPVATCHVWIQGRVQGVWYRGWTVHEARSRGLSGWVRNCSDGRVEAVFSGPPAAVDAMVAACHRGPPAAHVTHVTTEPWTDPPACGFHQRPSA